MSLSPMHVASDVLLERRDLEMKATTKEAQRGEERGWLWWVPAKRGRGEGGEGWEGGKRRLVTKRGEGGSSEEEGKF